ncbi:MAG: two-component regulator propeller domain-containing protein [Bacteroidia bacterium]
MFIAVCYFYLVPISAEAQTIYARHFTAKDGLPHNVCFHVAQDLYGKIWICTDDGMAGYEDGGFKRFSTQEGFTSTYPIMAVPTMDSNMMVAMWKGNVCAFDGERATFLETDSSSKDFQFNNLAIYSDSFLIIYKDPYKHAFLARQSDPYNFELHTLQHQDGNFYFSPEIKREEFRDKTRRLKLELVNDQVFAFTFVDGLFVWDKNEKLNPYLPEILGEIKITAMATGPDGSFWLGSRGKLINLKNNQIIEEIALPENEEIRLIKVSQTGKIILSMFSQTNATARYIYYCNPTTRNFINLQKEFDIKSPCTEFNIIDDDYLWIPTHGDGIYVVQLAVLEGFKHIFTSPIRKILQTGDGNVWVDKIDEVNIFSEKDNLELVETLKEISLLAVNEKQIIFSKNESGETFQNDQSIGKYYHPSIFYRWKKKWVVDLAQILEIKDSDLASTESKVRHRPVNINAMVHWDTARLYIGTDKGLRFLQNNQSGDTLQEFSSESLLAPIADHIIYDLKIGRDGACWIATENGLYKYFEDRTLKTIAKREHIPFWGPTTLLEDPSGTLWIGTQKGLLRYSGNIFKGINDQTGLISSEITSLCFSKKGNLWVGSPKGFTIIKDAANGKAFTYAKVPFTKGSTNLNEAGGLQEGIPLIIKLSAKTNHSNTTSLCQYSINDQPWEQFSNNTLRIEKLESGTHKLRLRGRLIHTDWYELKPFEFQVIAWWKSPIWLSILGGIVLIGLIIGAYFRGRFKKEKLYNLRLQKEIREREHAEAALGKIRQEIARDYHDELGNHLASITVLSSMAKKQWNAGRKETPEALNQIASSSKQLHAITKDFLWSIEGKWHYLDELVVYLADKGNAFFEPLEINFKLEGNLDQDLHIKLPISVGRNVLLIFKEAMTNIGKYAQAKKVTLAISIEENEWTLELENDGIEVPLNSKINSRGLTNMRARADHIGAELLLRSNLTRLTYTYPKESSITS